MNEKENKMPAKRSGLDLERQAVKIIHDRFGYNADMSTVAIVCLSPRVHFYNFTSNLMSFNSADIIKVLSAQCDFAGKCLDNSLVFAGRNEDERTKKFFNSGSVFRFNKESFTYIDSAGKQSVPQTAGSSSNNEKYSMGGLKKYQMSLYIPAETYKEFIDTYALSIVSYALPHSALPVHGCIANRSSLLRGAKNRGLDLRNGFGYTSLDPCLFVDMKKLLNNAKIEEWEVSNTGLYRLQEFAAAFLNPKFLLNIKEVM